jgi:hypothetical protein
MNFGGLKKIWQMNTLKFPHPDVTVLDSIAGRRLTCSNWDADDIRINPFPYYFFLEIQEIFVSMLLAEDDIIPRVKFFRNPQDFSANARLSNVVCPPWLHGTMCSTEKACVANRA